MNLEMRKHPFLTVVSISAGEYWAVIAYALSDWAKVLVVWTYIRFPILQRFYYLEKILSFLCRRRILKPWKRKLGQYSLLYSFHRNPCPVGLLIKRLLLLEKTRKGQKGSREIKLSTAVKRAVITSLKETRENLRIGTLSLERNGVLQDFRWVFRFNRTHAHTILVWHVAAEFFMLAKETTDQIRRPTCRISFRRCFMYDSDDSNDVLVANHLSRYCAYMVAFAALELLPEHKFTTVSVFDEVIKNARESLRGFKKKSKEEKYRKLREDYSVVEETVICYGVRLGRELMDKIRVEDERWKVLAGFWAEMVLYLAPSDDTRTHVEHLTRGGEFITHLWALLTHAGILQRQSDSDPV